jgi:hypothetical protein
MTDRLLRDEIESFVDMRKWKAAERQEEANKSILSSVAENWDNIIRRMTR